MNFTAARLFLLAVIALYFAQLLALGPTGRALPVRGNAAPSVNAQTSPPPRANAAQTPAPLPKLDTVRDTRPPCAASIRSAAFAGLPQQGGEIRVVVTGSAEVLKVGSAKGYTEVSTEEVCSAGECSIKTNNPGPYTLRFDACPPVSLGE